MVQERRQELIWVFVIAALLYVGTVLLMAFVDDRQTRIVIEQTAVMRDTLKELQLLIAKVNGDVLNSADEVKEAAEDAEKAAAAAKGAATKVARDVTTIKNKVLKDPKVIAVPVPAKEPEPKKRGLFGK